MGRDDIETAVLCSLISVAGKPLFWLSDLPFEAVRQNIYPSDLRPQAYFSNIHFPRGVCIRALDHIYGV